jgi:predicted aconitase with swiveling domain/8-oxo-dGTP pyrophosphatase MutT (NUDIX family)
MKIHGRRIVPGRIEGQALASPVPFSFVGGADPVTGKILDPSTGVADERLAGHIFVFPHGKGSTVGSYVIYGLAKRGVGPAGIVNTSAEGIVAVGAILAGIPMVDQIDTGGLQTGDRLILDGDRGTVELPGVRATPVVSAVLRNRGRILIVRRSQKVGSFRGRWSAISGHLEGREDPKASAVREVREETGLRGLSLRARGGPILARGDSTMYVVHPFLFDVTSRRVRLNWENVEHRWVRPEELERFQTVPRLKDVVATVLR